MSKIKIFNDPIYGLVNFPFEFIYDLIDHPYVQRLRRIQQLGMSSVVYPGATHTRFHHALGALHLCDRLIVNLRLKGIAISDEEYQAVLIATLLHDVGHGPYSHALEGVIISEHHERLTLKIMNRLNQEFSGALDLAIALFTKNYSRPFLSQIISSQLDVDRMDYLNRDSFYTGVAEGIIGYDRIIKMMTVANDQLVVEEKGIYSVEKFLLSRQFMYHQVYFHHAALAADHMLKLFVKYYKSSQVFRPAGLLPLEILLSNKVLEEDKKLDLFLTIDDSDVLTLLKSKMNDDSVVLKLLSEGLIHRRIFSIRTQGKPFSKEYVEEIISKGVKKSGIERDQYMNLVNVSSEQNAMYSHEDEINILTKESLIPVTFGKTTRLNAYKNKKEFYFLTYPK